MTALKEGFRVFTDARWPSHTGIGQVYEAYMSRKPQHIEIIELQIAGSIGAPLAPLYTSFSLKRKGGRELYVNPGFIPPLFGARRSIIVVHDLMHLHFYGVTKRIYYNLVLKYLYRRCAAIICVSDTTRKEFLSWSNIDPSKVYTVHNGVAEAFSETVAPLIRDRPYILYPGNHRTYKNLPRLLEAFARSQGPFRDFDLVLTGQPNKELVRLIEKYDIKEFVHFLGKVPQSEMPALYKGAHAVVFISLYEGFGLPILEGMACGVPVITSSLSSMPEVAGDAAIFVDPFDVAAITQAIDQLICDAETRANYIVMGLHRASTMRWDEPANRFWEIVEMIQLKLNGA